MNLSEFKELVNKIHKNTNNLAETGRILRDRYLILNIREKYNTKLSKLVNLKIPDILYTKIKNIIHFKKHIDSNPRDLSNKIRYHRACDKIRIIIHNLKNMEKLNPKFIWNPELSETIVNKFSY
jgi:ribosomal protein S15P/S13E